jgi:hypothetical protein
MNDEDKLYRPQAVETLSLARAWPLISYHGCYSYSNTDQSDFGDSIHS